MARERRVPPGIEVRHTPLKDGRVSTTYSVRWVDAAGERRRTSFKSLEDAIAFDAKVKLANRAGELAELDRGRVTLEDFFARWWEEYGVIELSESTLEGYRRNWRAHVRPRIGRMQLREIEPATITKLKVSMLNDGVGPGSVERTLVMLQGVLSRAVEWGERTTNPAKAVKKPKTAHRGAVVPLAPAVVEGIRAEMLAAEDLMSATLTSVLAYMGLRPAEALALRWANARDATLLVDTRNSNGVASPLKGGHAYRAIPYFAAVRRDLDEWRSKTPHSGGGDLIFPRSDGGPFVKTDWKNWRRRSFDPALVAGTERERARPYDLRHSFVSLLIRSHRYSIIEIAELAGHSPQMTLTTYGHVFAEYKHGGAIDIDAEIAAARAAQGLT